MHTLAGLTLLLTASTINALPHPYHFRYLGRVNPATNELTWPSTGLAFNFIGSSAHVPINVTGTNAIDIFVDGALAETIDQVNGTSICTPSGLKYGLHNVEIRKKSEADFGSIFFSPPTTPTHSVFAPPPPYKRIEFIGDSITVGYGEDGVYPCINTAALEDAPRTYGALTAKNLSYDYSIVAWSGKGVTRNYVTPTVDTSPTMPELWTRYGANDADNSYDFSYQPEIVVINLGTNDFSYLLYNATSGLNYPGRAPIDAATLTAAYLAFAKKVQKAYRNPFMFLTSSPLLSDSYPTVADAQWSTQANASKAIVAQLGHRAHFVDFPPQDQTAVGIGCDYHPSIAEHEIMAAILTKAIQAVIG